MRKAHIASPKTHYMHRVMLNVFTIIFYFLFFVHYFIFCFVSVNVNDGVHHQLNCRNGLVVGVCFDLVTHCLVELEDSNED